MRYVAYFDGACRGNPGLISAGGVIVDTEQSDMEVASVSVATGTGTNNESEYLALMLVLCVAIQNNITELSVRGDSQLVIKQVAGMWKVNTPSIIRYNKLAKKLAAMFDNIKFEHVKRDKNSAADKLANQGYMMDALSQEQVFEYIQNIITLNETT